MIRRIAYGIVAAVVAMAAACGSDTPTDGEQGAVEGLRVASFDFAESALLSEMYAQVIESVGVPVVRVGSVGPREIIAPAMELDRIDLVPEYLGTALQFAGSTETNTDAASAVAELNDRLAPRGLQALEPSPAQDRNVFVVTTGTADRYGLLKISDLAPLAAQWRFGGTAECPDRPLCLAGLQAVYGLTFAEFVAHRSLSFTATALQRDEVEVGLMFSTAAELADPTLVALVDDLQMQPAENITPVVRIEALEEWGPDVAAALDAMSEALTTIDLRALNRRVAEGEPVAEVAGEWLAEHGLGVPT